MSVEHVEFLVEEPSMEAVLRVLLPRMLGEISFEIYPHQCKDELLARLPQRLRGYSQRRANDRWFLEHCRIVVLMDRDDDNCLELKGRLETFAEKEGLPTRANRANAALAVVNRLAIEELESWYFGDWSAVVAAYPRVSSAIPTQARYRSPDAISGGTWEAFERELKKFGYFKGGLRKIQAARDIAVHMNPSTNTSHSFRVFQSVLAEFQH